MNQLRFNKILELQEKITKYFCGGYSGLELLFNYYLNLDNFVYNHRNFEDFYNGKPVEILGYYSEKNFIKNNGKVDDIIFKDFFEENFKFEYSSTYFNVFCHARNILQETINQIYQLSLDSDYTENEKSTIIQGIVLKISDTIEYSDKCNKDDNEILYDELIYISNGYKLTYNKICEMFGNYINIEKKIYSLNKIIDYTAETWFKIGTDFANGKIFKLKEKDYNYSTIAKELYGDDKLKNYISESFSPNPSNKNKCILKDHSKMKYIKEYFEKNSLEIHPKFINYFNREK